MDYKSSVATHDLSDTHLTDAEIKTLALKANEIRITVIEALVEAGSGHTAGPLGMADIFP